MQDAYSIIICCMYVYVFFFFKKIYIPIDVYIFNLFFPSLYLHYASYTYVKNPARDQLINQNLTLAS